MGQDQRLHGPHCELQVLCLPRYGMEHRSHRTHDDYVTETHGLLQNHPGRPLRLHRLVDRLRSEMVRRVQPLKQRPDHPPKRISRRRRKTSCGTEPWTHGPLTTASPCPSFQLITPSREENQTVQSSLKWHTNNSWTTSPSTT